MNRDELTDSDFGEGSMSQTARALCREKVNAGEASANWWFDEHFYDRARAICADCPGSKACLEYALSFERGLARQVRFGIWGGLTPGERAKAWKAAPKASVALHGTASKWRAGCRCAACTQAHSRDISDGRHRARLAG